MISIFLSVGMIFKLVNTHVQIVFLVGGHDVNNRPLRDCYYLTIKSSNEIWIRLPRLPVESS